VRTRYVSIVVLSSVIESLSGVCEDSLFHTVQIDVPREQSITSFAAFH
jgi:hypothetical protein